MLSLKPSVRIDGLRTEIVIGLMIAQSVYAKYGVELVVTCGVNGTHSSKSLHYKALALDLRTHNIPQNVSKHEILKDLKEKLGPHFDVIIEDEGDKNEHFHMEYDPKSGVNH